MAWTVDQATLGTNAATGFSTTIALTTTATVSSGAWVVLGHTCYQSGALLTSVSGGGLTWTVLTSVGNLGVSAGLACAYAPSGLASGTTITATNGNADNRAICGASFVGAGSDSVEEDSSSDAGAAQGWTTGTNTSLTDNALLVAATVRRNGGGHLTSTPVAPSVETHDFQAGEAIHTLVAQYRVLGAAGNYDSQGTWSGVPSDQGIAVAAVLSEGTVGPPAPAPSLHMVRSPARFA